MLHKHVIAIAIVSQLQLLLKLISDCHYVILLVLQHINNINVNKLLSITYDKIKQEKKHLYIYK